MVSTSHSEATVLPLELQQIIFELTGVLYPRMIPILMCLCRYAFHCMEPIRYRTIMFNTNHDEVVVFLRWMDEKPAGFFERAVRRLFVGNDTMRHWEQPFHDEEIERLLRVCTGAESLFVYGLVPSLLVLLAKYLRPTYVALHTDLIDNAHSTPEKMMPLFQNVTHLHLDTPRSSDAAWPFWGQLPRITPLTHLALSEHAPPSVLPDILLQCQRLQALVITHEIKKDVQIDDTLLSDRRVVLQVMTYDGDLWELLVDWEGIDTFIKKKESGCIEGRSFSASLLQPKAHTYPSVPPMAELLSCLR
ncbi:hypothetical protein C8J57DRAFT_1061308 [Mycena rebaudengoi]|nr:hypothetical protein C8J57DRAFT_1061308 [Mycena rebaudengoi]